MRTEYTKNVSVFYFQFFMRLETTERMESMSCTTILVGREASFDGSTMIARNEDSGSGSFSPKKFIVVEAKDQGKEYVSVLSHVKIPLPNNPLRYTCMPNAVYEDEGIWGAAGVNSENVSMTATETIACNERVLSGDPLVVYKKAENGRPEQIGGIGEEDMVSLVLPYIHSAREGVLRLGELLEQYGTYEMNGIAFSDEKEIWWLETIGGHHFIARRVPDNAYVMMPNQLGIDYFDFEDAYGAQDEYICSKDLKEFIAKNHLDLRFSDEIEKTEGDWINPRECFGTHSDGDHIYNTPRAWYMARYFNKNTFSFDGENAELKPEDDDLPWCLCPEIKITPEDVKYILSSHFQGTPYDCYGKYGDEKNRGKYRPIGISRNNFLSLVQIRPDVPKEYAAIEWVCFGSNTFNAFVPFYANVNKTPEYFANTTNTVTSESFYWANRIIAALADAQFSECKMHIERYQGKVPTKGYTLMKSLEEKLEKKLPKNAAVIKLLEDCNEEIAKMVKEETEAVLDKVLYEVSCKMKNGFSRSDA